MAKNRARRQLAAAKQEIARLKQTQIVPSATTGQVGQARIMTRVAQTQVTAFSGPLPPPELLAHFNEVVPGSAAKIIDMAHRQSEHRMDLEKTVIEGENRRANAGLICATALAVFIIATGAVLILKGHDWAGATLVGIDLVGVLTAFLTGTASRRREREDKAKTQEMIRTGRGS